MMSTHTHTHTRAALPVLSALGDQTAGSEEAELAADARDPEDEDKQEHREDQEEDDEQSRSNRVRLWRGGRNHTGVVTRTATKMDEMVSENI